MKRILAYAALVVSTLDCSTPVMAQTDPNPALNTPDKLAWTLFIQVNTDAKTAGNNNALFETWASDGETFTPNPVWPATPSPMSLRPRALSLEFESRAIPWPPWKSVAASRPRRKRWPTRGNTAKPAHL